MKERHEYNKNYYQIMGIERSATIAVIKQAYKKLALSYHPDKTRASGYSLEEATQLCQELNRAYTVLSDPIKRSQYDKRLPIQCFDRPNDNFGFTTHFHSSFFSYGFSFCKPETSRPSHPQFPEPIEAEKKAIHSLIMNDHIEMLDAYLKEHHFNGQSLLESLLVFAMKNGKLAAAKYFIEERDINPCLHWRDIYDRFDGQVIKLAAASGNRELVRYLVETHHADIESQSQCTPACPAGTALSDAAERGHDDIVRYLIEKGANVNPTVSPFDVLDEANKFSIFKLLVEAGSRLRWYPHLSRALREGDLKKSRYILMKKPGFEKHRISLRNDETIASIVITTGNLNLLKYLEEHEKLDIFSKNPEQIGRYCIIDDINLTLLSAAAKSGNVEMMRYLLEEKDLLRECNKIENRDRYIHAMLTDAENDHCKKPIRFKYYVFRNRLPLVHYLMEALDFVMAPDRLERMILAFKNLCRDEDDTHSREFPHNNFKFGR